jgi:hydroxyacylglutathione hydrolase
MRIEQLYTGCLAEAAYYIESKGEAAIIDPLRETQQYIDLANESNAKIKYVFETHFHADFVSGHLDLAKKTGSTIVFGPGANPDYDIKEAEDGEEFKIGDLTIKVLHTPGHTLESTVYLLLDESGEQHAIFSGDTLFLGDVGRPDLAIKSDLTKEDLAGMLYDSLQNKIMPLDDKVIVYPGHGAGSACGKNMSSETIGNLGNQKRTNYALAEGLTKEDFVKQLLDGILPPPQYFSKNAMMNKSGYQDFETVLESGNVPMSADEIASMSNYEGVLILDVRSEDEFIEEHIPDSIFIGLNGNFAPWVGALVTDIHQPILLVIPEGKEEEAITRLARVGYDNTIGYLKGGIKAWKDSGREVASISSIAASQLEEILSRENAKVVDVRKESEYLSEHIIGAENMPLDYINNTMDVIDIEKTNYIHCLGGYRSVIASSILKSRGVHNIVNIEGGMTSIKETGIDKSNYVCPTTL